MIGTWYYFIVSMKYMKSIFKCHKKQRFACISGRISHNWVIDTNCDILRDMLWKYSKRKMLIWNPRLHITSRLRLFYPSKVILYYNSVWMFILFINKVPHYNYSFWERRITCCANRLCNDHDAIFVMTSYKHIHSLWISILSLPFTWPRIQTLKMFAHISWMLHTMQLANVDDVYNLSSGWNRLNLACPENI